MEHLVDDDLYVPGHGLAFRWLDAWPVAASILVTWLTVRRHIPFDVEDHIAAAVRAVFSRVSPYVTVTVDERDADTFGRREAYRAAESYLSATCAVSRARRGRRRRRRAREPGRGRQRGGDGRVPRRDDVVAQEQDEPLHELLVGPARGGAPRVPPELPPPAPGPRPGRLPVFTNNAGGGGRDHQQDSSLWSHVKLAMDPARKREVVEDLEMFRDGKEYYASVGKAWKRGYLLHGPPGTGKSTMVAAVANFLDYDVYDLELTAVATNTELRRLFIETTPKSITKSPMREDDEEHSSSKVTLSGLLNFIDGLWSACGGERIIVFTTNHLDKLDPALIRRGRMDMRIEMSYCTFEAFNDHELFGDFRRLLDETDMTPADVAENLMPRSSKRDVQASLAKLVAALSKANKEAALAKARGSAGGSDKEQEGTDDEEEDGSGNNK